MSTTADEIILTLTRNSTGDTVNIIMQHSNEKEIKLSEIQDALKEYVMILSMFDDEGNQDNGGH